MTPPSSSIKTLIIGAGFAGLCMGAQLKRRGDDDFLIADKAAGVGGTWRHNTYPGAECDIPSSLYSYSFAPNPTWDFKWAKQPQILKYLEGFTDDEGLRTQCRFGVEVSGAIFDAAANRWTVQFTDGSEIKCQFLISAVGQLHHPRFGDFKGQDDFIGAQFHSAQWDHSIDLKGKNIAVIGNAASAIQLIPEVQTVAKSLTVYQRSGNWIIPKGDRAYSRFEKWLAAKVPSIAKLYRGSIWAAGEFFLYPVIQGKWLRSKILSYVSRAHMRKTIKDLQMRRDLTPLYPIGAKRVLLSDKIYPALASENVELVTTGLECITASGITDTTGQSRHHDIIVHATGFVTNPFLKALDIKGAHGQTLKQHWGEGASAYLGLMTHGFPNLFMLYGPNTNTGHTSIVYKIEAQVEGALKLMAQAGSGGVDVDEAAEIEFDAEMQRRLAGMTWAKIDASWYQDKGRVTNNWPGPSREYSRRARNPIADHFSVSGA